MRERVGRGGVCGCSLGDHLNIKEQDYVSMTNHYKILHNFAYQSLFILVMVILPMIIPFEYGKSLFCG